MSSVILAAATTAIEDRYFEAPARAAPPAQEGVSLLRRLQGLAAGLLFLAARVPLYAGVLLFGALVALAGVLLNLLQAVGLRLTRPAGVAAAVALALVSMAGSRQAKADTISLLQQPTIVSGSQQTNLYAFDAPGAGTLSVTLQDWGFPVPLQQLTASILFQDQSWSLTPTPGQSSQWQLTQQISTGGLYDAFVAAEAGSYLGLHFGAYSISIDFAPAATVPLPPAIALLLGGMGLLGAVTLVERISRRRNRDVMSVA